MPTEEELARLTESQTFDVNPAPGGTQMGSDIPAGKVRYIWGIILQNPGPADESFSLYSGDVALAQRNFRFAYGLPIAGVVGSSVPILSRINAPLIVVRPQRTQTVAQTVTENQIWMYSILLVNATILYYDLDE